MQTIPTMTRLSPTLRKKVEDIASKRKWKVSFTISQLLDDYLSLKDKNREIA